MWTSSNLVDNFLITNFSSEPRVDSKYLLSLAAILGLEDIVRSLLGHKDVDPNSQDADGDTALHCAARKGHESVVTLLMENKDVNVDLINAKGETAQQLLAN